jgi:DNA-binding FrmR family transcriptional regulator
MKKIIKVTALKKPCHPLSHHSHPDHSSEIPKLRRIKGQLEGIEKMINDRRYCLDVIIQIKAARAAMNSLENSLLKTHLKGCVADAFKAKSSMESEIKIEEIVDLLTR